MKFLHKNALNATVLLALLLSTFVRTNSVNAQRPSPRPEVITVGITEYQNIESAYAKYESVFKELAASSGPKVSVTFRIAIGTYGEVLDWYNTRKIDVAVLSAMPVADLLLSGEKDNLKDAYLGDLSLTPGKSASQRTVEGFPERKDAFKYRTGCVVLDSDKEIRELKDIQALWQKKQVKFLFVRPFSLSGYIVPLEVLRKLHIDPLDNFEFTYQHDKSLEAMICSLSQAQNANPGMHLVAFVLDDTRYDPTRIPPAAASGKTFRKIDIPELDSYQIPREIVLANYHQESDEIGQNGYKNRYEKCKSLMKDMFNAWHRSPAATAKSGRPVDTEAVVAPEIAWNLRTDDWTEDYNGVKAAMKDVSVPKQLLYRSNLDDLLDDISRYPKTPRVALVLSGGGAKCAYQAGAIVEVEKKLRKRNLDIGLVVGTSGGAINALLVALKVTSADQASSKLFDIWRSFKQGQFLQPSRRFSAVFGLCIGLLQVLLVALAVLLFDPEKMDRRLTTCVLLAFAVLEICAGLYFQAALPTIILVLGIEAALIALVIAMVQVFDRVVERTKFLKNLPHWRRLTIALMLFFGGLEALVANVPWIGRFVERISDNHYNHWVDHIWTVATLISIWSFPYPLLIAIAMTAIGWLVMPHFDWARWRQPLVAWTTVVLIFLTSILILEAFFKESSPSKVGGIEDAFVTEIPALIKATVDPNFVYKPIAGKTPLESISQEIMDRHLLARDLVITTSKLPVNETQSMLSVNSLPDDLYFYHRSNTDDSFRPPPDRRFLPLKYNQDKLLDVVIGSSTIYPIFPARLLNPAQSNSLMTRVPGKEMWLGNEDSRVQEPVTGEMRVIDGGFIHNIPIHAAVTWKATHVIVIEASPTQQQRDPRDFWDNTMMAFGYLFSQAQRMDTASRGEAETFELRPTSNCEKLNVRAVCTDKDGQPEPDMDTFDFSRHAAETAFKQGTYDVSSLKPFFMRVPGAPMFREVTATSPPTKKAVMKADPGCAGS